MPKRLDDRWPRTRRLKIGTRFEHQHDAGKAAVELVRINYPATLCRIVQMRLAVLESLYHHKVVEVPENDGRERDRGDLGRLLAITFGDQSMEPGRTQQIARLGSVATHPAFDAECFQRHMASVVRKNHRQRCGTAFDRLQLQDGRGAMQAGIGGTGRRDAG